MSRSRVESWSLTRSLAFLAAVLAMSLGAMVPAVVAASASTGAPIVLCSGGQLRIVQLSADETGEQHEQASLTCAMALMAGLAAIPTPDPASAIVHVYPVSEAPRLSADRARRPPPHAPPRPPSTAPPIA